MIKIKIKVEAGTLQDCRWAIDRARQQLDELSLSIQSTEFISASLNDRLDQYTLKITKE